MIGILAYPNLHHDPPVFLRPVSPVTVRIVRGSSEWVSQVNFEYPGKCRYILCVRTQRPCSMWVRVRVVAFNRVLAVFCCSGISQVMRRTLNLDHGLHIWFRGECTRNTSMAMPTGARHFTLSIRICLGPQDSSQISTCTGLSDIEHANSKFSKGYSTTGVVCTICSHEFVLLEGASQL